MTVRPCIEVGCHRLTQRTRCEEHQRAYARERNRRATHYRGVWRRISRAARAASPVCVDCGATTDLTADHVEPRSLAAGVEVRCRSCNASKGDRRPGGGS